MDQPSLARFRRELLSDALYKDGLVLDIRGNGGGNTHDAILEALSRHVYGYTQPRDGERQSQPVQAWTKPVVLLINQKLVQRRRNLPRRVPGAEAGQDRGRFDSGLRHRNLWGPTCGRHDLPSAIVGLVHERGARTWKIWGFRPDITVENTPEDIVAHRDRQLEVAIQTVLKELPASGSGKPLSRGPEGVGVPISANTNPNGGSSAVPGGSK